MKYRILLLMVLAFVFLNANAIGKLTFVKGDVKYQEGVAGAKQKALLQMPVSETAILILGPAAEAIILYDSGHNSELKGMGHFTVRELYAEAKKKDSPGAWLKRFTESITLLQKQDRHLDAAIRREKGEVQSPDTLLWREIEHYDLTEAMQQYYDKDYESATELFKKIIEQDPLSKEAEAAHGFLILIYSEKEFEELKSKQIELMIKDFPESEFIDLIQNR